MLDAPTFSNWWSHDYGEETTGDMIDNILGRAWQDAGHNPDHQWWRDAIENLVRTAETRIGAMPSHDRMHHRRFADNVRRHVALVRQGL